MAEFCMDCMKIISKDPDAKYRYLYSHDLDLCEGCGQWKRVIVGRNPLYPCNALVHGLFVRRKSPRKKTDDLGL
ncbi:MAG: hypothetical protein IKW00_01070 [Clostridia bacterium]|nr:hypothetical protein [Clostridia bacterium]